jgi:hypothetical protein
MYALAQPLYLPLLVPGIVSQMLESSKMFVILSAAKNPRISSLPLLLLVL